MYERERRDLADSLSMKGIDDIYVLKAIGEVQRHRFVPDPIKHHAYNDVALPIGFGQTISQPFTVAYMTQALKLKPNSKVLEIGTGSGYQAAILYNMGMKVYSIERQIEILHVTQKLFDKMGIRVYTKYVDGTISWDEFAPYNAINMTAGSPSVPPTLMKQLDIGGRLVIPVGNKDSQILKIITKTADDQFTTEEIPEFKFVPLIGREGWKEK